METSNAAKEHKKYQPFATGMGIEQVKRLISAAKEEITATEVEIALLQNKLQKQRSHLERLEAEFAPQKLLPPEVLEQIFKHTLPTFEGVAYLALPFFKKDTHWTIRHVCKTWRAVALDSPRLRNHIWLSDHESKKDPTAFASLMADIATLIIHHSSPLSFLIQARLLKFFERLLESLLPVFSRRVHQLRIRCRHAGYLRMFSEPIGQTFPFLQRLDLDSLQDTYLSADDMKMKCQGLRPFKGGTNVSKLSVYQLCPVFEQLFQEFPWHQLTDLTLEGDRKLGCSFECDTMVNFLRKCQNLRWSRLSFLATTWPPRFDRENPVILPHLSSLEIIVASNIPFDCLTLPSLTELNVAYDLRLPIESIINMIRRSSCSLNTFQEEARRSFVRTTASRALSPPAPPSNLCRSLLEHLPHVRQLKTNMLHTDHIEDIAKGRLLPSLFSLSMKAANNRFMSPSDIVMGLAKRLGRRDETTNHQCMPHIYSLHLEIVPEWCTIHEQYRQSCLDAYGIDLVFEPIKGV